MSWIFRLRSRREGLRAAMCDEMIEMKSVSSSSEFLAMGVAPLPLPVLEGEMLIIVDGVGSSCSRGRKTAQQ